MVEQLEILTAKQAADFLQLRHETLLRMIYRGEIPASKVGKSWRLIKSEIMEYLEKNKNINNLGLLTKEQ